MAIGEWFFDQAWPPCMLGKIVFGKEDIQHASDSGHAGGAVQTADPPAKHAMMFPEISGPQTVGAMLLKHFPIAVSASLFALAACSADSPSDDRTGKSAVASNLGQANSQLTAYSCADGTKMFTEQTSDPTTIYLIDGTTSHAQRLTTPSVGMAFFGDNIEVTFSQDGLRIDRLKSPPLVCTRL